MRRSAWLYKWVLLLTLLSLSGCGLDEVKGRVGLLVLVPFLLLMGVLWWLHRRPGEQEQDWEERPFPDCDDDDDENHYLM
ncbi:MAG: hypothetical protein ACQETD_05010 [Pseudomonadota bacterium]